mmetsp:Transcript_52974/g.172424  ORF Transcript_52974/g.172424 Transcript_52974/m.172424 type:complete len:230 (-) Transcript_52974:56-745(-)
MVHGRLLLLHGEEVSVRSPLLQQGTGIGPQLCACLDRLRPRLRTPEGERSGIGCISYCKPALPRIASAVALHRDGVRADELVAVGAAVLGLFQNFDAHRPPHLQRDRGRRLPQEGLQEGDRVLAAGVEPLRSTPRGRLHELGPRFPQGEGLRLRLGRIPAGARAEPAEFRGLVRHRLHSPAARPTRRCHRVLPQVAQYQQRRPVRSGDVKLCRAGSRRAAVQHGAMRLN